MRKTLPILLWLSVATGWLVSIFSVIQEMCLASACRDAAAFTILGADMGWFGIAYFCCIVALLWLRKKIYLLNRILSAAVFAGVGAEFRLLWIQKYIIGGWCPLCVTICCSLFITAGLLVIEKAYSAESTRCKWSTFAENSIISAAGFAIAFIGVRALV